MHRFEIKNASKNEDEMNIGKNINLMKKNFAVINVFLLQVGKRAYQIYI